MPYLLAKMKFEIALKRFLEKKIHIQQQKYYKLFRNRINMREDAEDAGNHFVILIQSIERKSLLFNIRELFEMLMDFLVVFANFGISAFISLIIIWTAISFAYEFWLGVNEFIESAAQRQKYRRKKEELCSESHRLISLKKCLLEYDDICAICREGHSLKEMTITDCGHVYGIDCLDPWIDVSDSHSRQHY
jgi:hypothetical protein